MKRITTKIQTHQELLHYSIARVLFRPIHYTNRHNFRNSLDTLKRSTPRPQPILFFLTYYLVEEH